MSLYTELHAHSNFSFLEGASHIEELVLRARELGYEALALTDHDGLHGAMEFAQCARAPHREVPIALPGCRRGEVPPRVAGELYGEADESARRYMLWFPGSFFV